MSLPKSLRELILGFADINKIKDLIDNELKSHKNPQLIVDELSQTLREVGDKYEKGELFLSELMMIGYLASEVASSLKPHLSGTSKRSRGKIIMGTVRGDIHDVGKNIVVMMLQADGWEVIDLGVDVPPEKFVEAISKGKPVILGLSALLTSTLDEMRKVIETLEKNGLRDKVKVIVGGRPITKTIAKEIGADSYAEDSVAAIKVVREMAGQGRGT
ncbi:MAG: corrinoid protein [Candidatus Bathyarchaeota archaeon]|nr:corrinoid protein [Candidatus Bathyarchaeota archaeon]